jgi:predicted lipoprotein with Yx(FWY)xxD motif
LDVVPDSAWPLGRHESKERDMKKQWGIGLSVVALAAALTGCGGGTGTTPTTAAPTTAAGTTSASVPAESSAPAGTSSSPVPAGAAELKTASSAAGQIVVDAKGMSVYFFTKDVKDSGTSACTGACIAAWPPVPTESAAPAVEGVTGTVGTISTPEGKKQVTINGLPVYYYVKDKAAGDITGQGVGNVWYLVDPAGGMVQAAAGGY